MQKEYYKNLLQEHKQILSKSRKLIEYMLDKLAEEVKNFHKLEQEYKENLEELEEIYSKQQRKFWWGDKESASSILTRLVQLLLKLIPLEQEIAKFDIESASVDELKEINEKAELSKQDIDILDNYLSRYKEESGEIA